MAKSSEKRQRKPAILNLYIKRKKRRQDDELVFECPTSYHFCVSLSKKFRSFRMSLALMILVLYCVTLALVLKDRITSRTDRFSGLGGLTRLAKRNLKEDDVIGRKMLEKSTHSPDSATSLSTEYPPIIKQVKLTDLKDIGSNRYIAAVSDPILTKKSMSAFGAWMKDPSSNKDDIYIMDQYFRNTVVVSYKTTEDFENDVIDVEYKLPTQWGGTGHVVYKGYLYFNRFNSSTMCKYSFASQEIVLLKNLPKAGYGNMAPYQWAGSTDIDFAVDSDGLWVVYATPENEWNITIAKLNDETLEVEKTWRTNFRKRSAANAFIVNGILYTLQRYDSPQTVLNYAFDTKTSQYFWPKIPFVIRFGSVASLDYNHKEEKLYAWDRGHQVTYDVSFK